MRSAPPIACLLTLVVVQPWLTVAHAQTSGPSEENVRTWQNPPTEGIAAPDVYLLPDSSGKLRQVLGFRYEDFLRAWNNRDTAVSPPRYAIEELNASGSAAEGQARLRIELRIASHASGWLDIPLGLPDLVIERVEIGEQTEGECLVYDAERGGHVAWLEGHPGQVRTISITGSAEISESAGKSALELAAPHATRSRLKLTVPAAGVHFETMPGGEVATAVTGDQTEVTLSSNARPLRLEWYRWPDAAAAHVTLESQGEMAVKIDRRSVLYTARLQFNSFGNPVDFVRVRLPKGASLSQAQAPPELRVAISEADDAHGKIVEVRPYRPANAPWTLEITAEQPLEEVKEAMACPVSGFEVLGAVRQSGRITLEVDEELQAYFDVPEDLEQVPVAEADQKALAATVLAAFEYARFPWTLAVHLQAKQRRVTIEPRYHLQLDPDEARLDLEFDYQFTGARTFAVRVDLRGWQQTDDPLESSGAVESHRIVETEQGFLVLPLVNPDAQRARIALVVRKALELGEQDFALPEALNGFVLPGQLVVEPDPSLQVVVDVNSLEGLSVLTNTQPETPIDDNLQVFRTFLARASLGASIARRERQVAVQTRTSVDVRESMLAVRQRFDYLVRHQPLGQVELSLPRALPDQQSLKVLVDDKETDATRSITNPVDDDASPRQLIVALPQAVQGAFQVELSYEVPYSAATPRSPAHVELPLAAPAEPLLSHEVAIEAQQPLRVALGQAAEAWTLLTAETKPAVGTSAWRLQSTTSQSTLTLVVQRDSLEDLQNSILERAWIQSWIAGGNQQDRSVFQFRTPHANVHVELPAAVADLPLEVLLDGEPVEFVSAIEGRLSVPLPHVSPTVRHVLELRYQRPVNLTSGTELRTDLPNLVCRPMSAPVYWQLVLPRGWQIAQSPRDMTSESWLGWKAYRWGRQPTRSQSDLEEWTGASPAPPPPPTTNQYLYSAFELPAVVEVVVTRQIWLVLATTLAAFGLGMLCVNTLIASRFSFWLGLALVLMALVFVYPELTLLAGQAILWGGVMTLVTLALRRAFLGRYAGEEAISPASSLIGTTSATRSWVQKQRLTDDEDDQPTVAARLEESKF